MFSKVGPTTPAAFSLALLTKLPAPLAGDVRLTRRAIRLFFHFAKGIKRALVDRGCFHSGVARLIVDLSLASRLAETGIRSRSRFVSLGVLASTLGASSLPRNLRFFPYRFFCPELRRYERAQVDDEKAGRTGTHSLSKQASSLKSFRMK